MLRLAGRSEEAQGGGVQSSVPPTAPAPWRVFEVEDTPGKYYYYNEETGESSWDLPTASESQSGRGDGAQSRTPPTVPAPWKAVEVDGSPGTYYYYNEETEESSWDMPTESDSQAAQPSEMGVVSTSDGAATSPTGPTGDDVRTGLSSEGIRLHPFPPWQMFEDEDSPGTWYYYNSETEETAWELPKGTAMLPPNWMSVEDEDEPGTFYYYNEVTEESSWDKPQAYKAPVKAEKKPAEQLLKEGEQKAFENIQAACQSQRISMTAEDLGKCLAWFREELHPFNSTWALAAQKDAKLFQTSVDALKESLAWLEEFLWNQDWATGFGRQRLSDAIQHCPRLLYQGVASMEDTVAWLAEKGVTDAAVREHVADTMAVPFPLEPYPWLEMLQLGRGNLERGFVWMTSQLAIPEEQACQILLREPRALLAAATAAGASELPYPGYPVPVPREDWASTQAAKYGVFVNLDLPEPALSA